jgi:hypothetical protein
VLSRRALLVAGAGGLALAVGCTSRRAKPIVDPDAAAIDAARRSERLLLGAYAEGTAGHSLHLAHLQALGGSVASPSPGQPANTTGVAAESSTVAPLMDAAVKARRGSTAALLASIAASHAALSEHRPQ